MRCMRHAKLRYTKMNLLKKSIFVLIAVFSVRGQASDFDQAVQNLSQTTCNFMLGNAVKVNSQSKTALQKLGKSGPAEKLCLKEYDAGARKCHAVFQQKMISAQKLNKTARHIASAENQAEMNQCLDQLERKISVQITRLLGAHSKK